METGPLMEWILDDFGVFIHGFCVSLVLPGVLLFLVLVLWNKVGRPVGLPLLIWVKGQDGRAGWGQLPIGMGVGVLVWQVFFAGYLAEEWATNYTWDHTPFCEARVVRGVLEEGLPHVRFPDGETIPEVKVFGVEVLPSVRYVQVKNYPGRFRYLPTYSSAFGSYSLVVFLSIIAVTIIAAVMTLVAYLLAVGIQVATGRSGAPFKQPWKRHKRKHDVPDPPYSPLLPAGFVLGIAFMVLMWWLWVRGPMQTETVKGPFQAANLRVGRSLFVVGGWGRQNGRSTRLNEIVDARREREKESKHEASGLQAQQPAVGGAVDTPEKQRAKPPQAQPAADPAKQQSDFERGKNEIRHSMDPYSPVFGLFFLTFVAMTAFTAVLAVFFQRISPAGWILFFLQLAVFVSTFLAYFVPISNQLIMMALIGLAVLAGRPYKLRFPNLEFGDRPVHLESEFKRIAAEEQANPDPPDDPAAPTFRTKFIDYTRRDAQGILKPPIALVCVSGGGSRAALWTMKVLERLEKEFLGPAKGREAVAFPYHIRLMTGASGGMLAGAAYTASLDPPDGGGPPSAVNRQLPLDALIRGTKQNFLEAAVHQLGAHDLWWVLLPFRERHDRGWEIEEAWRDAYRGVLDQTFDDLLPGERAGWRPSLIFSPMLVEDGRQLFISNLGLRSVTHNMARVLGSAEPPLVPDEDRKLLSREGVEFFELFPGARPTFQVGTAARMSASFPYILPAAILPTNPPRRVVDAGYYDNYGVGIALSWLASHLDWVQENTSGVVLIQIRDGESEASRRREVVADSFPGLIARGLQWATSPPDALWQSRVASNVFRNDHLIHLLTELLRVRGFPKNFFTTANFEFVSGENVSLSWTLTEDEINWVNQDAEGEEITRRVRAVVNWWHERLASPEARVKDENGDTPAPSSSVPPVSSPEARVEDENGGTTG